MSIQWNNFETITSHSYTCAYCGNNLVSNKGYCSKDKGYIYICHYCGNPTYIRTDSKQFPNIPYGKEVKHIDNSEVEALYKEARDCISSNPCIVGCIISIVTVSEIIYEI